MPRGIKVSRALVKSVKETKEKYLNMKYADVAKMCDTSPSTVSNVLRGAYDSTLGESAGTMDVEKLERLVAEADDYLRIIAFALIVLIDPDVKETHDMCARWRKKIDVYGYHGQVDKED